MRTLHLFLCMSLILTLPEITIAAKKEKAHIIMATYNLRYQNKTDSVEGNGWRQRCPWIAQLILSNDFQIFGTQEGLKQQLEDLKAMLPGYDYIGIGRSDGKTKGEHSAIFFRTDLFKLIDHGDFWLSETPDRPGKGWDAACERICTWGHFKHLPSQKEFLFFSLHMDHVGKKARLESVQLLLRKMKEQGGKLPTILVGDFNVDQYSNEYKMMTESGIFYDAYEKSAFRYAPNGTVNLFKSNGYTDSRIDHIFLPASISVKKYAILTDSYRTRPERYNDPPIDPYKTIIRPYIIRFPSDHYPVRIEVEF